MKIAVFYNTQKVEGTLSAYFVGKKYNSQIDPAGQINLVEQYDVTGLDQTAIDAIIAGLSADYHRIFNFCSTATGVDGSVSAAEITALDALLIGSSTDALSDDATITIIPTTWPGALRFGKNQAQEVWEMLFSFKLQPIAKGNASAGGATTLTDAAATFTVNEFSGMWLYIISGTGYGQYRKINGNGLTTISVVGAWGTNPAAGSVYQVCKSEPKPQPTMLGAIGGIGIDADNGTETAHTATSLTDGGKTWTVDQWAGRYVYIYDGTGRGQYRKITSNTIDTLVVPAWTTHPSTDSLYVICYTLDEVLLYEYYNRYLWVYCNDPANSDCVNILNKLFDNTGCINSSDTPYPTYPDLQFIQSIVTPVGKGLYDNAISNRIIPINPNVKFEVLTSGTLEVGKTYYMYNWITADDFANVGGQNVDDTQFVATGTTPTTWAAGSVLISIQ